MALTKSQITKAISEYTVKKGEALYIKEEDVEKAQDAIGRTLANVYTIVNGNIMEIGNAQKRIGKALVEVVIEP